MSEILKKIDAKIEEYKELREIAKNHGTFVVDGTIYGLEEAVKIIKETEEEESCAGCKYESLDEEEMPCLHCRQLYTTAYESVEPPYITDEEFVDYKEGTSHE